ncbi:MAG: MFS transporter, partial [Proteobacteria bacterium]|nr:MFS transporter [Pseudomonadota bacterium]
MNAVLNAAAPSGADAKWIGPSPSPSLAQIVAILFVGSAAILIAGLQPQLLGALAQEGRIDNVELGRAATAELLTIGIAAAAAGALLRPTGLRWWGAGASLALAAIDIVVGGQSHMDVVVNRALAGVAEGIMLWIPVGMIARSITPGRWSGIFLAVQTLAQLVFSAALPVMVMDKHGAAGGFVTLAIASVSAAAVSFLMPSRFANLPKSGDRDASLGAASPRSIAVLASVFLFMAFIVGLWAYFEPLSAQAKHDPHVYALAVSVSLAAQVLGATAASLLASRFSFFPVILASTVAGLLILFELSTMPGAAVFIALSAVFGFLWLFVMPFQVPMVIEADPTRQAALLMPGAQLL